MSTKQTENGKQQRPNVFSQLYRGETHFQFVPHRKKFYIASGVVIAALAVVMLVKGFVLGIDFAGGVQYSVPASDTSASLVGRRGRGGRGRGRCGQRPGHRLRRRQVLHRPHRRARHRRGRRGPRGDRR